jgi:hypothetical protein
MKALRRYGLLSSVLALSCGHAQGAQRPPAHAESDAVTKAQLRPAAQPASAQAQYPDHIDSFMVEHFAIVTWARNCVISGTLDALREPLERLSAYEYRSVAPGGWMPFMADLQEAAQLTSEADNLDLAATGVATMARVCGDCHRTKAPGSKFDPPPAEPKREKSDSFDERMQRHIWAADRMWAGLTEPSDEAWNAGAAALAGLPSRTPKAGRDPQIAAALQQVREVGSRALDATSSRDRADTYGLLLSTCANCHAHVEVGSEPETSAL